jgi:hypothetical protein
MSSRSPASERALGVALLCATLGLAGCQIIKLSVGSQLKTDPKTIKVGESTMSEVLTAFGAPERIQRQSRGDVFIYRYLRRDTRTFTLEEPVVTNLELYTYTRIREDADRLVVLFDDKGIVTGYGYQPGATENVKE